jgi:glycogen debranching enzyme
MDDVIQVEDRFYILATAQNASVRTLVLQHDDAFALFDRSGDIGTFGACDQGLYLDGTRHLSRFVLKLSGQRPLLLSSRVKDDSIFFVGDLTNPDFSDGRGSVRRDLVHVHRTRFLWRDALHEEVRLLSFATQAIPIALDFAWDADFADIFEIRGTRRPRRGALLEPAVNARTARLGYRGLDAEERHTTLEWSEAPTRLGPFAARFDCELKPREPVTFTLAVRCERASRVSTARTYEAARTEASQQLDAERTQWARFESSNERFNQWLDRSASDLRMLTAQTPAGPYPYAGVPWFSTAFGRDGIITALQTLWVNPSLARGVLQYLAATQAESVDPARDAEPGKILHETRSSEMARLGEVPFGRYYGSVDATPLFVVLAGAYYERTLDRELLERLWPNVERALEWIDEYGDKDGDGFVEYARATPSGLQHQGWKDSTDSVFHDDGTLAEAPIALCEVQAYVYLARMRASHLAHVLGHTARGDQLRAQAEALRLHFEERFWSANRRTYALALDGHKRQCEVVTSNAGHCLFGGIASRYRAVLVAERMLSEPLFSGWGVRTVAADERRYNPMSYHNGSIWPHDNALIAAGLSRYGLDRALMLPFEALFNASAKVEGHRLPELFCGFHRRAGEGPTLYPIACSPQAWSSGAVFHLLQSCLRLSLDVPRRTLALEAPFLPSFLATLRLSRLELPWGSVSLFFEKSGSHAVVNVLEQQGDFLVHAQR